MATADGVEWMPRELKNVAHECVGLARRTRRDLKRTADRCHHEFHALVERVLDDPPPSGGEPLPFRPKNTDADAAVVH